MRKVSNASLSFVVLVEEVDNFLFQFLERQLEKGRKKKRRMNEWLASSLRRIVYSVWERVRQSPGKRDLIPFLCFAMTAGTRNKFQTLPTIPLEIPLVGTSWAIFLFLQVWTLSTILENYFINVMKVMTNRFEAGPQVLTCSHSSLRSHSLHSGSKLNSPVTKKDYSIVSLQDIVWSLRATTTLRWNVFLAEMVTLREHSTWLL